MIIAVPTILGDIIIPKTYIHGLVAHRQYIQGLVALLPHIRGTTMVVISAQATDELLATLLGLKSTGRTVVLIKVGGQAPELNDVTLPAYHVPDEAPWDKVEKISMQGA